MNAVGRRMSRSNSTAYHQRQYSENFLDASFDGKWLHSSSQDFSLYGGVGGVQGSRTTRKSPDSSIPPVFSRSFSMRKVGDENISPGELSPGLIDIHSFDTELLPEVRSRYENYSYSVHARRRSYDDTEPHIAANKITSRSRGSLENNLLKSFSSDKERSNSVAKIKVVVRKRPLNKKEIWKKEEDIIAVEPNSSSLTVYEAKLKVDLTEYVEQHGFVFDTVLSENVSNDQVYSETVEPIVPLIFQRTKATCFAYGQTGSGKTYTMQPLPLKASQDIFRLMYHKYQNQGFQLHVSFFEIYGGKLFDLLNDRKKLCMREDGKQQVCIVGLQEYRVSDVETIKDFVEKGNATRSTGTTGANEESSRSHAILQLAVKRSANGSETKPARLVGKLSFIDLAGSERGADTTDNDKQTRIEGAEINKSLLALKECIRALDNDQGHIPFRGSKLTEVLRDSFVGDSRTVMISCISPSSGSCEHTLNTLRYADRVKSLSKGTGSKRDSLYSSSNLRDSTTLSLSSALPAEPTVGDGINDVTNEMNRFGWSKDSKPIEKEASPPLKVDRVPSGRVEGKSVATLHSECYRGQDNGIAEDDSYEKDKPSLKNNKGGTYQISAPKDKGITSTFHSDEDLNALLKEEESLISAHHKQVEETIEIVREEMDLLVEADQAGYQVDSYISKLSAILSQKAAGILRLQTRLAEFQKHLNEHHILVSHSSS
ncbi:kinesin-13A-like isoform X1 [Tripterygium wilfordii]|uniref:Kinesin-like protein n=1 Tax=Tripterygium wilfordii TaxID=458696 RepID=A0A7J7DQL6_TRIWF|nr:kinesin-like protein KIN-13B [Tripterygium wilfordii]KAF5748593.1 kinesin-13A-like isoform X1 [Tripterygium wilfordii]